MEECWADTAPRYLVTVDPVAYREKPDKGSGEIMRVSGRMCSQNVRLFSPQELLQQIILGHAWSPIAFNGARSEADFTEAQMLVVDFDGLKDRKTGEIVRWVRPDEVLSLCRRYELAPCIGHHSYSHTDGCPKFRLAFALPKPVGDARTFKALQDALLRALACLGADTVCKDAARMFFGTSKGHLLLNPSAVTETEAVFDAYCQQEYAQDPVNAARNVAAFARRHKIDMCAEGLLAPVLTVELNDMPLGAGGSASGISNTASAASGTCGANSHQLKNGQSALYKEYIKLRIHSSSTAKAGCPAYPPIAEEGTHTPYHIDHVTNGAEYGGKETVDFDTISSRCRLDGEFMEGAVFSHDITVGYCLNMLRCRGGRKRIIQGLKRRADYSQGVTTYQLKKLQSAVLKGFKPASCNNYCPYHRACDHRTNILQQSPAKYGQIRIIERPQEPISVSQAEIQLQAAFRAAIDAPGDDIWIIKTPCGLGKTENYIREKEVLVAIPTHTLSNEVMERAVEAQNDVIRVRDRPKLPVHLETRIRILEGQGWQTEATRLLYKEMERLLTVAPNDRTENEQELLTHILSIQMLQESSQTALVTQKRVQYMHNTPHGNIINDEDPVLIWIDRGSVSIKSLMELAYACKEAPEALRQALASTVTAIMEEDFGSWHAHTDGMRKMKQKDAIRFVSNYLPGLSYNIAGFLGAAMWCKVRIDEKDPLQDRVYWVNPPRIPKKKLIILSATADKQVWEWAVKAAGQDRAVHFVEIGPVKHEGRIVQCAERSYSRANMDIDDEDACKSLLAELHDAIGDIPVFSYKAIKKHGILNWAKAHFGALQGLDDYKRQDTCVLGVPHANISTYNQIAAALGISGGVWERRFGPARISRNGFEFVFPTFTGNPAMRDLQLWMVESEIVQALGRSRTLRYWATVCLMGNYPIPGAQFVRCLSDLACTMMALKEAA